METIIQQLIQAIATLIISLTIYTGCDAPAPATTECWATIPGQPTIYAQPTNNHQPITTEQ